MENFIFCAVLLLFDLRDWFPPKKIVVEMELWLLHISFLWPGLFGLTEYSLKISLIIQDHSFTTLREKCPNTDQEKLCIWKVFTQCYVHRIFPKLRFVMCAHVNFVCVLNGWSLVSFDLFFIIKNHCTIKWSFPLRISGNWRFGGIYLINP